MYVYVDCAQQSTVHPYPYLPPHPPIGFNNREQPRTEAHSVHASQFARNHSTVTTVVVRLFVVASTSFGPPPTHRHRNTAHTLSRISDILGPRSRYPHPFPFPSRACTSRPSHRTGGITDERTSGQFSAREGAINVVRQRDTATARWQPGLRGSGTSCVCASESKVKVNIRIRSMYKLHTGARGWPLFFAWCVCAADKGISIQRKLNSAGLCEWVGRCALDFYYLALIFVSSGSARFWLGTRQPAIQILSGAVLSMRTHAHTTCIIVQGVLFGI